MWRLEQSLEFADNVELADHPVLLHESSSDVADPGKRPPAEYHSLLCEMSLEIADPGIHPLAEYHSQSGRHVCDEYHAEERCVLIWTDLRLDKHQLAEKLFQSEQLELERRHHMLLERTCPVNIPGLWRVGLLNHPLPLESEM